MTREPMSMRDAIGRQVVSTGSAERIGEVKGFTVDSSGRQITSVHVSGRKKHAEFLEWSVLTFGPDTVMATDAPAPPDDDGRSVAAATGDIVLVGARVLDTDGFEHGVVDDASFDPATGAILSLGGDSVIDASHIRSLGSYAVMVDTDRR